MQLTLDKDIVIQSWSPGQLSVNDTLITCNCLIHGKQVFKHWQPAPLGEMMRDDFAAALELKPEIILLGTGATQLFPSIELITLIMQQGIAFEVMDTAAACRTFNVLNGESRSVVAALLV
ncbi:MAG: Mth938-like domain-containing protein [Gammaproteobacteria bacterium]|nr:Mth938-like domain-containing protein [Gammaproteobacteria bacterium]